MISIHAPRTGSDGGRSRSGVTVFISIHAPRTGSDGLCTPCAYFPRNFNPRSPHGERHHCDDFLGRKLDFNPRSPHGERRCGLLEVLGIQPISIHAPRTGSDGNTSKHNGGPLLFQSTLPARGATRRRAGRTPELCHFNPRSPHGERLHRRAGIAHVLQFQSTLPARGATARHPHPSPHNQISIHAPRTGSDQINGCRIPQPAAFQSTLPARGATWDQSFLNQQFVISIHAPRTGSDRFQ